MQITNLNIYYGNNRFYNKSNTTFSARQNIGWMNKENTSNWIKSRTEDLYSILFTTPIFYKQVGDLTGKTVLDLGCGSCEDAFKFARHAKKVIGLDCSKDLIASAKLKYKDVDNLELYCTPATDLSPIKSGSIDKVVSKNVLMYLSVPQLEQCCTEIDRILKPGGEVNILIKHPFEYRKHGNFDIESGSYLGKNQSYFDHTSFSHNVIVKGKNNEISRNWQVEIYPKMLQDYLIPFINKGYRLTNLKEPTIPDTLVKRIPYYNRFQFVPSIMTMDFLKA